MWVSVMQPTEDLSRRKRPPLSKKESPADCLQTSSATLALTGCMADGLQTGTEAPAFLGLKPAGPPCRFRLVSLHNHVSQFLIINFFIYIYTYILLVLFLQRTLTNAYYTHTHTHTYTHTMVCHHVGTKYKITKKSKNIWSLHGARRGMETDREGVLRNTGRKVAKNSVQEKLTRADSSCQK